MTIQRQAQGTSRRETKLRPILTICRWYNLYNEGNVCRFDLRLWSRMTALSTIRMRPFNPRDYQILRSILRRRPSIYHTYTRESRLNILSILLTGTMKFSTLHVSQSSGKAIPSLFPNKVFWFYISDIYAPFTTAMDVTNINISGTVIECQINPRTAYSIKFFLNKRNQFFYGLLWRRIILKDKEACSIIK